MRVRMSPLPRSIVERLADPESTVFESALVDFRDALPGYADGVCAEIVSACRALADADALDSTERCRRVGLILLHISLADTLSRELAKAAAQFPAEIRNAIVSAVPARFKGLAYGRAEHLESALVVNADHSIPIVAARPTTVEERHQGLVLLLGSARDHEHNRRCFKTSGFVSQRANTIEDFRRMLNDEVCGIVVAKSWWHVLPTDEHSGFLDELLAFSSFVWLKINTNGLFVQDIFERFKGIRFCEPRAAKLQASESHDVADAEVPLLYASAEFSRDAAHARLYPGEIPARDVRLIVGSTKAYVQDRNSTDRGTLHGVSAKIVKGGCSGTMLVHVSTEGRSLPFVAKIGEVDTPTRRTEEVPHVCRSI